MSSRAEALGRRARERRLTPESPLRHPGRFVRFTWDRLRESRFLARTLFWRDFEARRRRSLLGVAWLILPPLLTAGVFLALHRSRILSGNLSPEQQAPFILTGAFLWQCMTAGLRAPLDALGRIRGLLPRVPLPVGGWFAASLGMAGVATVVRLSLLFVLLVALGARPQAGWLLVPLAALACVGLGAVLGTLLVPAACLVHDVQRGLPFLLAAWIVVTPVGFRVPDEGILGVFASFNPLRPAIEAGRQWLLEGPGWASPGQWALLLLLPGLLFVAIAVVELAVPILAERLPS